EQLLKQAHRAYRTEMNDLLLTALGMAIREWSGLDRVPVNLEGHGREEIIPDVDVSRTVGWFTSQFPVVLELGQDEPVGQRIKRVKEGLRHIPNKGIGYGILRYLSAPQEGMKFGVEPEISFNYLGQFDQDYKDNDLESSAYSGGLSISENAALDFALDLNGMVSEGELVLTILYGTTQYRRETVERLGGLLQSSLREIIAHCVAKERPELTPSDVLFKGLTLEELERLAERTEAHGELENVYALSPMQKGMLFHNLMDAESGVYFEQASFDLHGRFDTAVFGRSLELLVQRHGVLRTNFYTGWKDEPLQVVYRNRSSEFLVRDLRDMEEPERAAAVEAFTRDDKARGFDLANDSLMRVAILRTGEETYRFVWSFHHILMDGWCWSLVTSEVFRIYFALSANREPELLPVPPFSEYIAWLERQDPAEASRYWSGYLAGYEEQTTLPKGRTQEKTGYASADLEFDLGRELTGRIHRIAQQHQVTISTLMQTVWGLLLQKYNGSQDVVFGNVVSGRPEDIPNVENMVGLFINTVPVRIRCEAESTFAEVMAWNQEQSIASHAYDTYPLYEIQALTEQKQDLISHIMIFENYPMEEQLEQLGEDGASFTIKGIESVEQTNYDLNLVVLPGETIHIFFGYNALAFDHADIERMYGHLVYVLEQIAANPQIRVSDLEVVTPQERAQIIEVFNATAAEYPQEQTIHGLIEAQAERTPDQTAVYFEGERLTYRELNERANRLARTLRARGVTKDRLVGLMTERSLDLIVGIAGILKAGGAYVPIDPEYPEERIRYMLDDSGAELLLVQSGLRDRTAFTGTVIELDAEEAYSADGSNLPPVSGPDDLAYVIYTSGTTGKPKGVMVEHHGLCNLKTYYDHTLHIGLQDKILQFASYSFDAACWEFFQALFCGATLYIPTSETIQNYRLFEDYMAGHGITVAALPPTYAVYLDPDRMPSLRILFTAGSASSTELIQKWKDRVMYYNGYGPTENSIATSIWPVSTDPMADRIISIGRPVPNHRVYMVDPHGHLLPAGVAGELCVAGAGLARGYLHRPELTAEKFVTSRFAEGERMYRTGDLARWMPDGKIEYLGRIDHQVKIRGYRIELGEVEAQILKAASTVQETIVIAREDASGQNQLCAYFVADREVAVSELRSALAAELPNYMVPSYFVQLEQMPLTPNGKIDRKALPAPEESLRGGAAYAKPRTAMEQTLVSVWQAVLGTDRIGILDNFFDLGGDSIKAIQVASRLLQSGYRLEMKNLFAHPTVAELGGYVQLAGRMADQGDVRGEVKPTPILHWFFEQRFAEPHHFNQAVMLHHEQGFDEAALRQAVTKLAEHHDALRIVVRENGSGKFTLLNRGVGEGELYSLDVVDFRGQTDFAEALEAKASEIQSGIDLSEGPLMKLGLFRCDDGDHLLIAIHHLAVDGVSWRILFEDLATGYEQALKGEAIRLPQKTDSFRTWAEQLTHYANSPAMDRERAYWQEVAKAERLPLPKDNAVSGQAAMAFRDSETVTAQWMVEETEQLLKQANRAYNTEVNDLLLAALGMAVHAWTGMERVLVNLEGHGREAILPELDITRTVGWFTSQYPVVLETGANWSVSQSIKRVKEGLRRIPNKGIGYGIVRYLSDRREGFEIEPEISFNYLGQFDQDAQHSAIRVSPYAGGESVSGSTVIKHALNVSGMIAGGALSLDIRYNSRLYRKETMEKLAGLLKASLREVLAQCAAQERPELTPSDLLFKGLTVEELDAIADQTRHVGEIENVYALTPMQKGMLFHSLMEPDSGAYFQQAAFDLLGDFDTALFIRCLDLLTARHEALRTNFYTGWKEEPLQIVYRRKGSEVYLEDLRGMGEAEREAYIAAFTSRDKARGFDLAQDALMRVSILRTGEQAYRLIWSFHHIVMDGWCLSLVTSEVFGAYYALAERREPEFAEVTPFGRYIEWLERQDAGEAAAYWKQYLAGYEQQTLLPKAGSEQGQTEGYVPEQLTCELGQELSERMNRIAKQHQVTINTLMQTAWGVLLQKYNNNRDVVFGSVVSGRPADIAGVESMIGLFINTIPVRIQTEAETTFADLLRATQEQALRSGAYDTFPLYEIQALAEQKQDLINHIMVFENFPVEQQVEQLGEGGQAAFEIANVEIAEQTNYDLDLIVMPEESIQVVFRYNARVYDQATIDRMRGHLVRIMEQAVADPNLPVSELELATAEEQAQILHVWGDTDADYPKDKTLYALFEEQAERTPDRVAVVFEDEQLTYRELNERANRLARTLRAEGVQPDQPVGILIERSLEMIVGIYGILKAGGAYVPIDPEYPEERIRYMLEDSGAQLLLTLSRLRERVVFGGKTLELDDAAVYDANGTNLEPAAGPTHLAYVIYTSGSTGKPKGVMIEHHSVINRILWMHEKYPIGEADTILQKTTFTFDVSVWELFWWSLVGSKMCLLSVGGEKSPERLLEAIGRYGVTTMHFVPAMLHAFLEYAEEQPAERLREKLGTLRQVFASGEALPAQHVARFQQAVASIRGARLINLYGPTEATVDVSYFDCEPDGAYPMVPIGKPIHNTRLYIMEEGTTRLQPIGVAGELCIAGVNVARGYLNRPELTAEKFVPNPFVPGERMYRTGDLARWMPDGNIEYLGRIDHQVKIRGYRIELGEVEAHVLNEEAVLEAVVVAREDGAGQKLLCAYFVADREVAVSELRSALSAELPNYMVPSYFVQLEQMPLT
ncbi:non-ribosomal peptide synthetase, partial [Paenibacillus ehimensis]